MKKSLVEGEDYYLNPQGLFVFTAKYLRERGYCCGSGCKHCPYTDAERQAAIEAKRRSKLWW
jgi:hypothetical protein